MRLSSNWRHVAGTTFPINAFWPTNVGKDHGFDDFSFRKKQAAMVEVDELDYENRYRSACIAGDMHCQSGHTTTPGGQRLVRKGTNYRWISDDEIMVSANMRWRELIPILQERGKSPIVAQSEQNFTIGGSLSINCHGQQYGHSPFSSTVIGFGVRFEDGRSDWITRQNPLFGLVGGNVISSVCEVTSVALKVADDLEVCLRRYNCRAHEVPKVWEDFHGQPGVTNMQTTAALDPRMGKNLWKDAAITMYLAHGKKDSRRCRKKGPGPLGDGESTLAYKIFRASVGSKTGAELRWRLQKRLALNGRLYRRSSIYQGDVDAYRFDHVQSGLYPVLIETHVPMCRFADYLLRAPDIINRYQSDVWHLNTQVRHVNKDRDSLMPYATEDNTMSFVSFFMAPRDESGCASMTSALTELTNEIGGRSYLAYRGHYTLGQIQYQYRDGIEKVRELRDQYNPTGWFRNDWADEFIFG